MSSPPYWFLSGEIKPQLVALLRFTIDQLNWATRPELVGNFGPAFSRKAIWITNIFKINIHILSRSVLHVERNYELQDILGVFFNFSWAWKHVISTPYFANRTLCLGWRVCFFDAAQQVVWFPFVVKDWRMSSCFQFLHGKSRSFRFMFFFNKNTVLVCYCSCPSKWNHGV